jgi:hypothetical protein
MTPAVAVTATFTAPPTATAEAFTTAFQTALVVPAPGLLGNDDANGGDGLTAVLVSNANHGTLTLSGDGGFSYTPNPQFVGSDTFSYSAINSAGTSNTVIVTIAVSQPTEPQPVSDFYVSSVVGNRVTVRWKSPTIGPVTTGFELAGGLSPGQVLATLPVPGTAPIFTFDAPTGVFHIRLHTIAGAARSAASNEVRLVVNVPEAPSAPADFAAVVDGSGLGLAWRSTFLGGAATTFVVDATGTLNVSVPVGALQTAIFADVPAGTYTLTLRATNDGGASAASNPVTISIPSACSGAPLPPSNALAYTVGDVLTVVWDPATSGPAATSFLVNVAGSIVSSVPVSSRTFSSSLPVGQYHLTVQATNSCGTSAPTASQMVQIP